MSDATGLGMLEVTVLESLDRCGGFAAPAPFRKSQLFIDDVYERHGVGPSIAYEVLCDLARPYVAHLPLIDFHGNYGSPDFGPAAPRYTEARLSVLGAAALAAERGEGPPLPVGLVNGDTHHGGRRPPLDPSRAIAAIRASQAGADDAEVAALVGLPAFPTGCAVAGDATAFARGDHTLLELSAVVTVQPRSLVLSNLPPGASCGEIAERIGHHVRRATRSPVHPGPDPGARIGLGVEPRWASIVDVNDASADARTHLVLTVRDELDDAGRRELIDLVLEESGARRHVPVQADGPIADVVRRWIERIRASAGDAGVEASLTTLEGRGLTRPPGQGR